MASQGGTGMRRVRRALRATALLAAAVVGALLAAFALAVLWPQAELPAQATRGPVAITDVTIVDVATGTLRPGHTVITDGPDIVAVGPSHVVRVPVHAHRIDGRGRWLMPALWDMHTHVYAVSPMLDLPLYIAYGVTNVRDMQGCPAEGDPFIACHADKQRWTREAVQARRVAPRIVESTSFMANGPGMAARLGNVPAYFDVATPDQARAFVRHFLGRADAIKVYDNIPAEAYAALVDEARTHGLAVVGHRPRAVSAREAARHQRSIEHARFLLHDSFDGSDALHAAAGTPAWREDRRAMVDRHDPARALAIFEAMREHGTWYVPTHLTRWSDAYADTPAVREDPALRTLHPLMRLQWQEDVDALLARDPSPAARQAYVDFYRKGLELTRQAHQAGVRILVGTDYIAPGLDVHRELEQLVTAGLDARDALAAATIAPAEYAGLSDRYGAIAPGRVADLVLLDADPLADIRNTRAIRAVLFNGNVYDEHALAAIHDHVAANARSWTVGAKMVWRFLASPANY